MSKLDQSKPSEASQLAAGALSAFLRVLDVKKLLLGGCRPAVPRARTITSLDAGKEFGLVPIDALLCDPVHPEALIRGGDVAWDHGTACDLGGHMQEGLVWTMEQVGPRVPRVPPEYNLLKVFKGSSPAESHVPVLWLRTGLGETCISTYLYNSAVADAPLLWAIWSTFFNSIVSA